MSDVPFGFGLPDRDPERRKDGDEPNPADPFGLGALFGGIAGGGSPEDVLGKMPLFAELQKLMNWSGGPVNWDLARQGAISQLAVGPPADVPGRATAVAEALRLADLWLDQVTELPSGIDRTAAWSRVEWVEKTLPAWGQLIDPLAEKVVAAMTSALPQEAATSFGPITGIMGRMGGLMFGAQVGQALGKLADEVVTSTDVGLPLAPAGTGVLVPQNVAEFAAGLDRPADEVRLFLALREAASQRLFAHVPWLRQQLQDAVHAYARGITIDREAIERGITEAMSGDGGRPGPEQPREHPAAAGQRGARAGGDPRAADGAAPPGDAARPGGGLGGHRRRARPPRTGCPGTPRWPRPCAAGVPPAGRPSRPSPRSSGCSCGPAGCATPPPCGRPWVSGTAPRTATGSGRTPTCCRPPTTSTSRWTSSPARGSTTSSRS